MTNLLRVATALALATLASCCRLDDSCDACESNPLALECQQNCTDDPNSPECGPQSCSTGIVQIAGCACDATSAGTQAEVAVRHHQQHTEVWCWAAVTSAVIDYYSHLMGEDCQLLSAYAYQRFGQDWLPHTRPVLRRVSGRGVPGAIAEPNNWHVVGEHIPDEHGGALLDLLSPGVHRALRRGANADGRAFGSAARIQVGHVGEADHSRRGDVQEVRGILVPQAAPLANAPSASMRSTVEGPRQLISS